MATRERGGGGGLLDQEGGKKMFKMHLNQFWESSGCELQFLLFRYSFIQKHDHGGHHVGNLVHHHVGHHVSQGEGEKSGAEDKKEGGEGISYLEKCKILMNRLLTYPLLIWEFIG